MNKFLPFILVLILCINSTLLFSQIYNRSDTLLIEHMPEMLDFEGAFDQDAWTSLSWNSIGHTWMPYNNEAGNLSQEGGLQLWESENDFTGRYKVGWSPVSNRIYFLVEITDDVFVDGYVFNEDPSSGGNYPAYDIVEVFIDEDRSGGLHVFDGTGSTATQWGFNAENAFSYHLAADAPEDGLLQNNFHALDIAGTNWGYPNQKVAEYSGHFPQFVLKKEGTKYTWAFSLQVHNADYDDENPQGSVVILMPGKVIGLTVAYCDNDDPREEPKQRDHFFGSVDVPLSAYNDHWKNADWFGVAKLVDGLPTFTPGAIKVPMKVRSNIRDHRLEISVNTPENGNVFIRVMNILGTEMMRTVKQKRSQVWNGQFDLSGWGSGVYLLEVIHNDERVVSKFIVR